MSVIPRSEAFSGSAAFVDPGDDPSGDQWPDLKIPTAPSLACIPAGRYQARTTALQSFVVYRRRALVLWCDVYRDDALTGGVALARLPAYFRLPPPGRPLSPSSKLARLFELVLGARRKRLDRLPMNALKGKLFRVEVGDVVQSSEKDLDGRQRALPKPNVYSVVRAFVERLA